MHAFIAEGGYAKKSRRLASLRYTSGLLASHAALRRLASLRYTSGVLCGGDGKHATKAGRDA
jgi:hypothetical protein